MAAHPAAKSDSEEPSMIRFLHTSDWQLGMTRHFLAEGAQERYSQSRFDAIRTMGRIAKDENCKRIQKTRLPGSSSRSATSNKTSRGLQSFSGNWAN